MQKLKLHLRDFFYLIGIIVSLGIAFYFTNHNNLKEHINLQNEHLKDHINLRSEHLIDGNNRVEGKIDGFKQETQENFNKVEQRINKLTETIIKKK